MVCTLLSRANCYLLCPLGCHWGGGARPKPGTGRLHETRPAAGWVKLSLSLAGCLWKTSGVAWPVQCWESVVRFDMYCKPCLIGAHKRGQDSTANAKVEIPRPHRPGSNAEITACSGPAQPSPKFSFGLHNERPVWIQGQLDVIIR